MDSASRAQDFDEGWAAVFLDEVQHYDTAAQQQAFSWLAQAKALHLPILLNHKHFVAMKQNQAGPPGAPELQK